MPIAFWPTKYDPKNGSEQFAPKRRKFLVNKTGPFSLLWPGATTSAKKPAILVWRTLRKDPATAIRSPRTLWRSRRQNQISPRRRMFLDASTDRGQGEERSRVKLSIRIFWLNCSMGSEPSGAANSPAETGESVVVKSWSKSDFGHEWKPPLCTGWTAGGFTTLVTVVSRLPHTSRKESLLRRIGAISELAGMRYWLQCTNSGRH